MTGSVNYRSEIKYRCTEAQLALIHSRLQSLMLPDPHAQNGSYAVRSLYFDNYANRCYFENESGVDLREKFRIRIYNASDSRITLECKRKEHGKSYKTACPISMDDYRALLQGGSLRDLGQKPALLRKFSVLMHTQLFRPAVIVAYERTPYVYNVGNVRVTFDRGICSSQDFGAFFSEQLPSRQILPKGEHILEIKYDELLPAFIKEALQTGDLRQSTFSKYYLCRKHSMGGHYEL